MGRKSTRFSFYRLVAKVRVMTPTAGQGVAMESATREIFWQIGPTWLFYAASAAAAIACAAGLWGRARVVLRGARFSGSLDLQGGLLKMAEEVFTHRRILEDRPAGVGHLLILYSFVVLSLVTLYVMVAGHLAPRIFTGYPYLALSLAADLAGCLLLLGVCLCLARRSRSPVRRPAASAGPPRPRGAPAILAVLGLLALSGFLLEGLRIHLEHDPWRAWSPAGWAASWVFAWVGEDSGAKVFRLMWWVHALGALGLIALLPFCGLFHIIATPAQLVTSLSRDPLGRLPRTDLLELLSRGGPLPARVGVGFYSTADLAWKHRLEVLSCVQCGRCESVCPACLCDQPLSPLKMVIDERDCVLAEPSRRCDRSRPPTAPPARALAEAVDPQAFWACRLCRACEAVCPASLRHTLHVIELRRGEVLGHGRLPADAAFALRSLARTGNPYNASPAERDQWVKEHAIPTSPRGRAEKDTVLVWTGCFNQGDETKVRVMTALARLLQRLRVDFAVLGSTETCCGEPARNLGDEALFQALARRQIERIEASGARRVLVHCPHCYTVLKDEYPTLGLGASFEVIHTSLFFMGLIEQGRLCPEDRPRTPKRVAFHDPCFLGRYHGLYDPPRRVLQAVPGVELVEPGSCREHSLCCGAGGGHFFMDIDVGQRPSARRLQELLALDPDVIGVSCTFCNQMFHDASRLLPDSNPVAIVDWVELLASAVHE